MTNTRLDPIRRDGMASLATISDNAEIAFLRGSKNCTIIVAEPDKPAYWLEMVNGKAVKTEVA